jgi:hypothetical protein
MAEHLIRDQRLRDLHREAEQVGDAWSAGRISDREARARLRELNVEVRAIRQDALQRLVALRMEVHNG